MKLLRAKKKGRAACSSLSFSKVTARQENPLPLRRRIASAARVGAAAARGGAAGAGAAARRRSARVSGAAFRRHTGVTLLVVLLVLLGRSCGALRGARGLILTHAAARGRAARAGSLAASAGLAGAGAAALPS